MSAAINERDGHRECYFAAPISILKGESEALLRVVERIDTLYSSAEKETDGFRRKSYYLCPSLEEFDKALEQLPERLWVE